MRHDVDDSVRDATCLDEDTLLLVAMRNDPCRTAEAEIHHRLRCIPCTSITEVVTRIMYGEHDRISTQQGQGEVEPQVTLLQVDHIGIDFAYVAHEARNHAELVEWLAEPRLGEWLKTDGGVHSGQVSVCRPIVQQQSDLGVLSECARQSDAARSIHPPNRRPDRHRLRWSKDIPPNASR